MTTAIRATRTIVAALLAAAVHAGCTSAPERPAGQDASLVWPGPPATPRIAHVGSFSGPEDLGIRRGFLQRLADALFGADDERLVRPMSVAEDGGLLYVADPGARGVHRFDRRNGRHELLRGPQQSQIPSPVGLAVGKGGVVYVTDSALRQVLVLRPGAGEAEPLSLEGSLGQPTGIAWDPERERLLVVDTRAHRIAAFTADGRRSAEFGQRGDGPGEFNYPTFLWRLADGRLLVTDSLNFRVQTLDADGRPLARFGRLGDGTGDIARHKGIATDRHGHIYLADALFHAIQVFDANGGLLLAFGAQGREAGEFWLPAGIHVGSDDTIYVADSYNQRVQMFRYLWDTP